MSIVRKIITALIFLTGFSPGLLMSHPPQPTPDYCVQPLRITDLEDAWLAQTRADHSKGFCWLFVYDEYPADKHKTFGRVFDSGNNFLDYYANYNAPLYLLICNNSRPTDVRAGDYVTIEYDGGQTKKIYPPPLSGVTGVFYIGLDGSTYNDRELSSLAKAVPTPTSSVTPYGYKTPSPTPSVVPKPSVMPKPSVTPSPMALFLRLGEELHYLIGLLVVFGFQLFYEYLTVKVLLIAGAVILLYAEWRWRRKNDIRQILLLLILGLALGLGMFQLDRWPMRIHPDEPNSASLMLGDLKKIESAEYDSFDGLLRGVKSHPAAGHWWNKNQIHAARLSRLIPVGSHLYWLVMKFCPVSYVSARSAMVITGMLTVLMVYLLMRRMFGSRIALIAAFFQAVSPWNLALSRIFLNYAPTNFYAVLYLYVLWRATRQFLFYPLLAVILMFSVSMYSSIKAVYYFTPVYLVYYLWSSRKKFLKRCCGLLVFVFVVWLLLLPGYTSLKMIFGYNQSGASFVGGETFDDYLSNLWTGFNNLRKEMYSFSWKNYYEFSRRNYIELGLRFNPIILALSLVGVGFCLVKVKKKESIFLLLWLVCAMAPDVFSNCRTINRRATLIISPLMCLAAVGLGALTHWPKWNRKIGVILICVVVLVTSTAGYFVMYWLQAENSYSKDMIKMHGWMEFFMERYDGRSVYLYGCSGVSGFLMRNKRSGCEQRGYTDFCLWNRKDGKIEKSVARGITNLEGLESPFVVMVMDKPESKGVLEELKSLYPEHKVSEFSQKHSNGWVLRVTAFSVD